MHEKETFAEELILQNKQISDGWKFLFTQMQQPMNKEEMIEFENHHSVVPNKFSHVGSDHHSCYHH